MAADRWGLSWGGDGGVWSFAWGLLSSPGATEPEYRAPFLTAYSPIETTVTGRSELVLTITGRATIDEDA